MRIIVCVRKALRAVYCIHLSQVQLGFVASAWRSIQTYNNQRMSDIRYLHVLYKSGPDIRAQRTDLAVGGIITQ